MNILTINKSIDKIPKILVPLLEQYKFIPAITSEDSQNMKLFVVSKPSEKLNNLLYLHFGNFINIEVIYVSHSDMDRYLYEVKNTFIIKELVGKIKGEISSSVQYSDWHDSDLPAVKLLIEHLVNNAISSNASDIHIDVTQRSTTVKERIDGFLKEVISLDREVFSPISLAIKLMSNIDISKTQHAHDGRFSITVNNSSYDFRVSIVPTIYGESIVIRILDQQKEIIGLESLGICSGNLEKFKKSHHMV